MKRLIAEFEKQSFTQIIFPHENTDWSYCLDDAKKTFAEIIDAIQKFQPCFVICKNIEDAKQHIKDTHNIFFAQFETNDTWARDCSTLCVEENNETKLLDFTFNGWGKKFEALKDNAMSSHLQKIYTAPMQTIDFVLEGGSVESNGEGIILTTSECVLNQNRNPNYNSQQITQMMNESFGSHTILYLENGFLAGDDTDSHIDTLARFVSKDTIMYVKCYNQNDLHFQALDLMEKELKSFAQQYNFKLIPLPLPSAIYDGDERLPATYANFLFVNGGVIVPIYNVKEDANAIKIFEQTFKDLKIVGVNCETLIRQHGSLHCVTMNFASGVELRSSF